MSSEHNPFSYVCVVPLFAIATATTATSVFVVATTATAAIASAAASTTTHVTCHFGKLFVGSRTALYDFAHEVEVATCHGVVHVHHYCIGFYLYHTAVYSLTFGSHQWYNGSGNYALVIELAINLEDVFGKVEYMLVVVFAIGFGTRNGEIELIAFVQVAYLLFERIESET